MNPISKITRWIWNQFKPRIAPPPLNIEGRFLISTTIHKTKGVAKMNGLTIIKKEGGAYIDSRDVAEAIGKQHKHLLRDIRGYCEIIGKAIEPNFGLNDFFLESSYVDTIGRALPCYLVSKMGCEMIANKLIGEKGVLFTAAYVSKFNAMEASERAALEAPTAMPKPRLGEINACARIIVRGLKQLGAAPEHIMSFLIAAYQPLGFVFDFDPDGATAPRWHNASGIARECGLYSLNGKPHGQAVASLLNEIICIGDGHKRVETDCYGFQTGFTTLYDDSALLAVMRWLVDNGCPNDIYAPGRTYHIQYFQG
jgi:Rha family phage regulatory protein